MLSGIFYLLCVCVFFFFFFFVFFFILFLCVKNIQKNCLRMLFKPLLRYIGMMPTYWRFVFALV